MYFKYISLKRRLCGVKYKGYPLDRVMGSYIALLCKKSKYEFIRKLLTTDINVELPESSSILLTYTIARRDYLDLMERYFGPDVPKIRARIGSSGRLNIKALSASLRKLPQAIKVLKREQIPIGELVLLLPLVVFAIRVIDNLEKKSLVAESYVAFNSSYLFESFLSYYFKKRGVRTYSLQHGMYFKFLNTPPIDVINYENVCAKTLLVWGAYTKQQIKTQVPADVDIKVVGYPAAVAKKPLNSSPHIYVLLPRKYYEKQILSLLKILSGLRNEKFIVRLHPLSKERFDPIVAEISNVMLCPFDSLAEGLSRFHYKKCIGFNSTAIFEAVIYKQSIALYLSDENEFLIDGVDSFSDDLSLGLLLNKHCEIDPDYFFSTNIDSTKKIREVAEGHS